MDQLRCWSFVYPEYGGALVDTCLAMEEPITKTRLVGFLKGDPQLNSVFVRGPPLSLFFFSSGPTITRTFFEGLGCAKTPPPFPPPARARAFDSHPVERSLRRRLEPGRFLCAQATWRWIGPVSWSWIDGSPVGCSVSLFGTSQNGLYVFGIPSKKSHHRFGTPLPQPPPPPRNFGMV